MQKTEDYRKTIRMNPSLYQKLERLAEKQNRNFSNLVVTLLKETIEQKEEQEIA